MAKKKTAKKKVETHVINNKKTTKKAKRKEVVYTIAGKQEYFEQTDKAKYPCIKLDSDAAQESPDAFAMKITIGKRIKYYAKRGKHGRLYNPIGMFSEGMASKRLGHAGKLEWRFTEVGERVFLFYRDFLRTKNIAHLHNAERELL